MTDPVALWVVRPAGGAIPVAGAGRTLPDSRRARAGLVGLGAGVVVIAVVGIAALAESPSGAAEPSPSRTGSGGPTASAADASASPVASAAAAAFRSGPLEPGTYRTTTFSPGLSLTLPDGWTGLYEIPNALMLGLKDDPMRARYDVIPASEIGGRLTIMRPSVAASPCTPRVADDAHPRPSGWVSVEIPAGRDGFLAWARSDPTFALGPPRPARLGAFDTTGYEVSLSDECDLRASTFDSAEIFTLLESRSGQVYSPRLRWGLFRGSVTWWYLWEIGGQTMLVAIDTPKEFPEFEAAARSVLTSLKPAD